MRQPAATIFLGLLVALAATGLLTVGSAAQEGKAEDGAEVFKKCRSCHEVGPSAKNKLGPNLNDLFGRKAGSVEGFGYSDANKAAGAKGLVWNDEVLMKYLEEPRAYIPGTNMAFAGLRDEQDRRDVIAYLKTFSKQ